MQLLLSALLGGLTATVLSVLYHYYAERYRRRTEVLLSVVGWADGIFVRLWDIHVHKDRSYTEGKNTLDPEVYKTTTRELRSRLLANEIPTRVALVYGESEELGLVNQLRGKMLDAARKLWKANQSTWKEDSKDIMQLFEKEIDPLRQRLERQLLRGASRRLLGGRLKERESKQATWKSSDE